MRIPLDPEFVGNAATFLEEGLCKGGAALLIASRENGAAIASRLAKWQSAAPGRMTLSDADQILEQIATDGFTDELDFHRAMAAVMKQPKPEPGAAIYIASELVPLAKKAATPAVAAEIEKLWDDWERRRADCVFMIDFAQTFKFP